MPENQIKEMLKEKVNIGQLESFLAHEIGHHIAGLEIFSCNIVKDQKRKKVIHTCLFEELRATEEGLKLIDKIYGIKNWRIELRGKEISKENFCDYILGTVDVQCKNCIYEIVYSPENCLKFEETFEVRKRIWRLLN